MWDILLQNLPLVVLIVVAIIICGADLIKAIRVWREEHKRKTDKIVEEKQKENDILNELKAINARFDTIENRFSQFEERIAKIEQRIEDLTESDMHDIKSWIVDQYHKFYIEQGWIDAFNADTLDKRYEDYKKEGGNSYIDTLMKRLHSLPMDPPQEQDKK